MRKTLFSVTDKLKKSSKREDFFYLTTCVFMSNVKRKITYYVKNQIFY